MTEHTVRDAALAYPRSGGLATPMQRSRLFIILLAWLLLATPAQAGRPRDVTPAIITSVAWTQGRLRVEADRPLRPRLFTLHAPERVVIDLFGAELADPALAQTLPIDQGPYTQLRVALHPADGFLRFVLDCARPAPVALVPLGGGTILELVAGERIATGPAPIPTPAPTPEPEVFIPAPPLANREVLGPEIPPTWLNAYGPPMPPEWERSDTAGPPLPDDWGQPPVLGPPVPGSVPLAEILGPPMRGIPIALGPPRPAPSIPAPTPAPVATPVAWDGGAQPLRAIQWERRRSQWVLRLTGERPLVCDVRQEWVPPRLSIRVPRGSFAATLPPAPDRGLMVEAVQEGTDWVLRVAMPRAVYGFEARQQDQGKVMEVAWGRQMMSDSRPTVLIDPGHGGSDPGALGPGGTHEASITLALARATREALAAGGDLNVVLTRTADTTVDLASRARLIEALRPAMIVSLHGNSCTTPEIGGMETYYRNEPSQPLARFLHQAVVGALNRPDRGIRQARLYVLRHPSVPSVLLEAAYLSNPEEERLMGSETFQAEFGTALARGIRGYLAQQQELTGLPRGSRELPAPTGERVARVEELPQAR